MKTCRNCLRRDLPDTANVCGYCGIRLESPAAQPADAEVEAGSSDTMQVVVERAMAEPETPVAAPGPDETQAVEFEEVEADEAMEATAAVEAEPAAEPVASTAGAVPGTEAIADERPPEGAVAPRRDSARIERALLVAAGAAIALSGLLSWDRVPAMDRSITGAVDRAFSSSIFDPSPPSGVARFGWLLVAIGIVVAGLALVRWLPRFVAIVVGLSAVAIAVGWPATRVAMWEGEALAFAAGVTLIGARWAGRTSRAQRMIAAGGLLVLVSAGLSWGSGPWTDTAFPFFIPLSFTWTYVDVLEWRDPTIGATLAALGVLLAGFAVARSKASAQVVGWIALAAATAFIVRFIATNGDAVGVAWHPDDFWLVVRHMDFGALAGPGGAMLALSGARRLRRRERVD